MLSRIMELWRGKSLISQMLDEFAEMLDLGKGMFDTLARAGLDEGDLEAIRQEFFDKDKAINRLQQSIRRKILVHLSVHGDTDIPACMVLMSVAKDAERLGDYAKNVFEVFDKTSRLARGPYYDLLVKLAGETSGAFANVANVFKQSDAEAARQLKEANYRLEKACDAAIGELLGGAACETAVAYALLFRFLKRILAHLSNIVSTVVMPVDKIDYFDSPNAGSAQDPAKPG